MRLCIASLMGLFLCGCVMTDSKIATVKPASVPLASFAGYFSGKSSYNSKYWMGFEQMPEIQNYIPFSPFIGHKGVDSIRIQIELPVITIEALQANEVVAQAVLVESKDFEFESGIISLRRETEAGGRDSPSFGVGTSSTRLFLDEKNDLVIVQSSAGMGLLLIVPVAAAGNGMLIFERIEEPHNEGSSPDSSDLPVIETPGGTA